MYVQCTWDSYGVNNNNGDFSWKSKLRPVQHWRHRLACKTAHSDRSTIREIVSSLKNLCTLKNKNTEKYRLWSVCTNKNVCINSMPCISWDYYIFTFQIFPNKVIIIDICSLIYFHYYYFYYFTSYDTLNQFISLKNENN